MDILSFKEFSVFAKPLSSYVSEEDFQLQLPLAISDVENWLGYKILVGEIVRSVPVTAKEFTFPQFSTRANIVLSDGTELLDGTNYISSYDYSGYLKKVLFLTSTFYRGREDDRRLFITATSGRWENNEIPADIKQVLSLHILTLVGRLDVSRSFLLDESDGVEIGSANGVLSRFTPSANSIFGSGKRAKLIRTILSRYLVGGVVLK